VSFGELIERSDVLSVHVPLTPATDKAALYDALVSGKLHGAGLDVFAMEPADGTAPLFRLDQVVVTPHTAGSVIDLVADIARHAFTNMQSVLRGTPLPPDDVIVPPGENK
jgi:phosphoglycerate dehydrogenase-like enzyme